MSISINLGIVLTAGISLSACSFDPSNSASEDNASCVSEACVNCPGSDGTDSDNDGVADLCDLCSGSDDGIDSDNDGVPDGCDVCEGDDDADIDGDNVPDACDFCGIGQTLSMTPTAFWRMDNGEDLSGNGLSLVGTTTISHGLSNDQNPASRFDSSTLLAIENFPMPTDALSISMWVRLQPDSPAEQYFVSYFTDEDQINIGILNNRMYVYWTDVEGLSDEIFLRDGDFHHLALVYDSQDLKLLVDGAEVIQLATSTPLAPGGTLTIGQEQDELGGGFDSSQVTVGDIDEMAVFARPLSAMELRELRGSYQCAAASCLARLEETPGATSGTYWIAPDGLPPRLAFCDMSFDGGGWTLISTNSGEPSNAPSTVTPDIPAHMPFSYVSALATMGDQIHLRTKDRPDTESITTSVVPLGEFAANHPMTNLRNGKLLNNNSNMTSSNSQVEYWEGPYAADASKLWNNCANGRPGYPSLYWACGNGQGLHILNDDNLFSLWDYSLPNISMEVYVR